MLEYKCPRCGGTGNVLDPEARDRVVPCLGCRGTGYVLTEEGKALLAFLSRHLGQLELLELRLDSVEEKLEELERGVKAAASHPALE